jgi:ATP-dependent RNA helicase SUPV3L1/SUV3
MRVRTANVAEKTADGGKPNRDKDRRPESNNNAVTTMNRGGDRQDRGERKERNDRTTTTAAKGRSRCASRQSRRARKSRSIRIRPSPSWLLSRSR